MAAGTSSPASVSVTTKRAAYCNRLGVRFVSTEQPTTLGQYEDDTTQGQGERCKISNIKDSVIYMYIYIYIHLYKYISKGKRKCFRSTQTGPQSIRAQLSSTQPPMGYPCMLPHNVYFGGGSLCKSHSGHTVATQWPHSGHTVATQWPHSGHW